MNLEISYANLCACIEQQALRQLGYVHDGEDIKLSIDGLEPDKTIKLKIEVNKQEMTPVLILRDYATEKTQLS